MNYSQSLDDSRRGRVDVDEITKFCLACFAIGSIQTFRYFLRSKRDDRTAANSAQCLDFRVRIDIKWFKYRGRLIERQTVQSHRQHPFHITQIISLSLCFEWLRQRHKYSYGETSQTHRSLNAWKKPRYKIIQIPRPNEYHLFNAWFFVVALFVVVVAVGCIHFSKQTFKIPVLLSPLRSLHFLQKHPVLISVNAERSFNLFAFGLYPAY